MKKRQRERKKEREKVQEEPNRKSQKHQQDRSYDPARAIRRITLTIRDLLPIYIYTLHAIHMFIHLYVVQDNKTTTTRHDMSRILCRSTSHIFHHVWYVRMYIFRFAARSSACRYMPVRMSATRAFANAVEYGSEFKVRVKESRTYIHMQLPVRLHMCNGFTFFFFR